MWIIGNPVPGNKVQGSQTMTREIQYQFQKTPDYSLEEKPFHFEAAYLPEYGLGIGEPVSNSPVGPPQFDLEALENYAHPDLADENQVRQDVYTKAAKKFVERYRKPNCKLVVGLDEEEAKKLPWVKPIRFKKTTKCWDGEIKTKIITHFIIPWEKAVELFSRYHTEQKDITDAIYTIYLFSGEESNQPIEMEKVDFVYHDFFGCVDEVLAEIRKKYLSPVLFEGMPDVHIEKWRMFCLLRRNHWWLTTPFWQSLKIDPYQVSIGLSYELMEQVVLQYKVKYGIKDSRCLWLSAGGAMLFYVMPSHKTDWYICMVDIDTNKEYPGEAAVVPPLLISNLHPQQDWSFHIHIPLEQLVPFHHSSFVLNCKPFYRSAYFHPEKTLRRVKQRLVVGYHHFLQLEEQVKANVKGIWNPQSNQEQRKLLLDVIENPSLLEN